MNCDHISGNEPKIDINETLFLSTSYDSQLDPREMVLIIVKSSKNDTEFFLIQDIIEYFKCIAKKKKRKKQHKPW